jgi:hypothetical protein
MPVPIPLTPWVGLDTPHVNDKNRAEYAVLYTEMEYASFLLLPPLDQDPSCPCSCLQLPRLATHVLWGREAR